MLDDKPELFEAGRNAIRLHLMATIARRGVSKPNLRRVVNDILRKYITDDLFNSSYSFKRVRLRPEQLEDIIDQLNEQRPNYLSKIILMAIEIGKLRVQKIANKGR